MTCRLCVQKCCGCTNMAMMHTYFMFLFISLLSENSISLGTAALKQCVNKKAAKKKEAMSNAINGKKQRTLADARAHTLTLQMRARIEKEMHSTCDCNLCGRNYFIVFCNSVGYKMVPNTVAHTDCTCVIIFWQPIPLMTGNKNLMYDLCRRKRN